LDALARLALAPNLLTDALQLLRDPLVGGRNFIERIGDLAEHAVLMAGHADGKIADAHGLQGMQQIVFEGGGAVAGLGCTVFEGCFGGGVYRGSICSGFNRLANRLHNSPSGSGYCPLKDARTAGKCSKSGTSPENRQKS